MKKKYRVKNFVELANMPETNVIEIDSKFGIKHNEGSCVATSELLKWLKDWDFEHDFKKKKYLVVDTYKVEEWMCEDLGQVSNRTPIKFNSKEEFAEGIIKYKKLFWFDTADKPQIIFDVENYPTEPFRIIVNNDNDALKGIWQNYNHIYYIETKTC